MAKFRFELLFISFGSNYSNFCVTYFLKTDQIFVNNFLIKAEFASLCPNDNGVNLIDVIFIFKNIKITKLLVEMIFFVMI